MRSLTGRRDRVADHRAPRPGRWGTGATPKPGCRLPVRRADPAHVWSGWV